MCDGSPRWLPALEVLVWTARTRFMATAHRLWVTVETFEKHVRSILIKLDLPATGDGHRQVFAVITFLEAH